MRSIAIAWIILLITGCTIPKKNSHLPLNKDVLYFDCDSFPGNFSESSFTADQPISSVRGVLRLNEARRHAKWAPSVNVGISSKDRTSRALLRFSVLKTDGKLYPSVSISDEQGTERLKFSDGYDVGKKIVFSFSKINSQEMVVRFGEPQIEHKVQFNSEPYIVKSSCATAWAEINVESIIIVDDK